MIECDLCGKDELPICASEIVELLQSCQQPLI